MPAKILLGLLCFACGFGAAWAWRNAATTSPTAPAPGDTALAKLQSLAASDLEDYYRLQSLEERYQKADEILGKIMQIFLADLGLHISREAQQAAQAGLPPRAASAPGHRAAPPDQLPPALSEPPKSEAAPAPLEEGLLQAREERAITASLRELAIKDLRSALKETRKFTNAQNIFDRITGTFLGQAQVETEGKRRSWQVQLDLNGAIRDSAIRGKLEVRMSENGQEFSHRNDSGDVGGLREFLGDSKALLMEASPDTYFQLYHLKSLDMLAGNIYERKDDEAPFHLIGQVQLKRR